MQGVFSTTDSMELDTSDVQAHMWDLQPNFHSPTIKFEVSAPRINKDNNMMELGKKLLLKSKLGQTEEVKELMSRGAPFTADWVGTSPLHWTAHYNHVDVTDLLLKAGISRDARNKVDRTPLHVAAQKGHLQIVQLLLQYGADVNCKDMLRMTPLHWAAESGCADCVQTLLDYGADATAVNKFDKTPAKVASDNNNHHLAQTIEAAANAEPSARVAKRHTVRQTVRSIPKLNKSPESNLHHTTGPILKTIGRRKQIGIVLTKQEGISNGNNATTVPEDSDSCLSSNNTLQLLQAHGITMLEPDNGTVVSTAVENGQTVMLTEAGKLALGLSKTTTNSSSSDNKISVPPDIQLTPPDVPSTPKVQLSPKISLGSKFPLNPKILSNAKKVITIRADELINMTKEKKFIIKQAKPLQPARIFQGKLYSHEQEGLLIEKITNKLVEAQQQAEMFRLQMEKKEQEAESYKRQLESIKSARQKLAGNC